MLSGACTAWSVEAAQNVTARVLASAEAVAETVIGIVTAAVPSISTLLGEKVTPGCELTGANWTRPANPPAGVSVTEKLAEPPAATLSVLVESDSASEPTTGMAVVCVAQ